MTNTQANEENNYILEYDDASTSFEERLMKQLNEMGIYILISSQREENSSQMEEVYMILDTVVIDR